MPKKVPDLDSLPVMVPRNDKRLAPVTPVRVQRLETHLRKILSDLAKAKRPDHLASRISPEPDGFRAVVASAACSLCSGHCCRNGDEDAFLDEDALARMRLADPDLTDDAMVALYLDRVPACAYRDSCIFHGKQGCTLDRSMRADICNRYYCGGLSAYLESKADPEPTVVIAGDSENMRVSSVLMPANGR